MKTTFYAVATILSSVIATNAFASAAQFENRKMHCAIFKNDKLVKQQKCIADGYEHAGAGYGGGQGWNFKNIPGIGKISIDSGVRFSENKTNPDGSSVIEKEWLDLNDKPAVQRYRTAKNFKPLTSAQEKLYYEGKLKDSKGKDIALYSCYFQKNKKDFEFCFNDRF